MTAQKETVVTAERLAQGLTYEEWISQIDRNVDKFKENYDACTIDPAEAAKIKALMAKEGGPATCLALCEAFCPDVFRGLPTMARLAEATGLDLKVFFRDANLDIMNEFLNKGEFQSVPTLVFYTKDAKYIGHWIERAVMANEQIPMLHEIQAKLRNPELAPEERQKYMKEYTDFQRGPVWDGWRHAQVTEIRELLEQNC
jgi:Thioredoxin